jgi:hypothetical protein
MEVIGWIAWGFTLITALFNLITPSRNVATRDSKIREGILTLLVCGAVLVFGWNKLLTPIAIPVSLVLSMMVFSAKLNKASSEVSSAMEESQRTGEPYRDILKREHGIVLPDND